jgi:NAD(P)-dependent dehydrogenase (short-subunit alcohol dehydrogenase family)
MEQSLKGKSALVTGASRGIGRAIAERLAKDGATVALTYNASKSGAEAVAAIEKVGGTAFAIHADLVDPPAVPALFERLDDEFTKRNGSKALDIVVNNAGNSGWVGFKDATPTVGTYRSRSTPARPSSSFRPLWIVSPMADASSTFLPPPPRSP